MNVCMSLCVFILTQIKYFNNLFKTSYLSKQKDYCGHLFFFVCKRAHGSRLCKYWLIFSLLSVMGIKNGITYVTFLTLYLAQ